MLGLASAVALSAESRVPSKQLPTAGRPRPFQIVGSSRESNQWRFAASSYLAVQVVVRSLHRMGADANTMPETSPHIRVLGDPHRRSHCQLTSVF